MRRIINFLYKKLHNQKEHYYNLKFKLLLWMVGVESSGVKVCKGCPIVDIQMGADVSFGRKIWINNYHNTGWYANSMIHVGKNAKLSIGDGTGLNGALVFCEESISIGKYVNIGGGTRIYDTDFHPLDWQKRMYSNDGTKTAPIIIEDNVFIGTNCIIGKGKHIGARSIIGAGSVVTKDIPADCIAAGNPCKVIRMINQ